MRLYRHAAKGKRRESNNNKSVSLELMMNGQRKTGPRRYSPSLRNAAEALYGTRAKPALSPALPVEPSPTRAGKDLSL